MFFSESVLNIINELEIYSSPGFSNAIWIPQIQSCLEEIDHFCHFSNVEDIEKKIINNGVLNFDSFKINVYFFIWKLLTFLSIVLHSN